VPAWTLFTAAATCLPSAAGAVAEVETATGVETAAAAVVTAATEDLAWTTVAVAFNVAGVLAVEV